MSKIAVAADGTKHVFPDDTDPSVMDKAMMEYAGGGSPAPAQDDTTPGDKTLKMMNRAQRVGTGMNDPVVGSAQTLAHYGPPGPLDWLVKPRTASTEQIDQYVQNREQNIRATSPPGEDPYRLAGNFFSPMNLATRGLPTGGSTIGRLTSSVAAGAVGGAQQPATHGSENFATEKGLQVATGGAIGGVLRPVEVALGKVGSSVWNWIKQHKGEDGLNDKAMRAILTRMDQDVKGGGPTTQDMLDLLRAGSGKPLTMADVGGENLLGLLGKIQRQPGEAKQIISKFLKDRDVEAGLRLKGDIDAGFGGGSAHDTFDALKKGRSIMAAPLFDKAYEGGSTAPLKRQFERAFADTGKAEREVQHEITSIQARITAATAKQHRAGNDVYSVSAANQELRSAQAELAAMQQRLQTTQAAKDKVLERLRAAQADETANAPGAIWNPRIQEFLDNPRVKQGIRRGWRIERDKALAENRPINAKEYAIIGTDAEGEPIVGAVPTMRLLAVAKEGLDSMVYGKEFRTTLTGELDKEGVAIDQMRRSFLKELDGLNPNYKAARDQWSGDTLSMEALRQGQQFTKRTPEELRDIARDMNPNDLEFFRLGAASALQQTVAKTGAAGNEARGIAGNQHVRDQLRPFFPSEAAYTKFIEAVTTETRMFDTKTSVLGNSATAGRHAEDAADTMPGLAHAARGAVAASHGHPYQAARDAFSWISRQVDHARSNPELNAAIARLMADPAKAPQIIQQHPEFAKALAASGAYAPWLGPLNTAASTTLGAALAVPPQAN